MKATIISLFIAFVAVFAMPKSGLCQNLANDTMVTRTLSYEVTGIALGDSVVTFNASWLSKGKKKINRIAMKVNDQLGHDIRAKFDAANQYHHKRPSINVAVNETYKKFLYVVDIAD